MISIIIPVKKINKYVQETVPEILKTQTEDFEIIIVTDKKDNTNKCPKTKIINSGEKGPAFKRDLAVKYAKGDILAFLDDDAYPEKDWLKNALLHFKNKKVAAVGGPAITPSANSLFQKASGAVSESFIGGGGARNRFLSIGKAKKIDDWPTVNLLVRKNIFEEIGGFDTNFWPGEDTKLCLDILNKGYKIIYEPKTIVYHHRRNSFFGYFKQVGNYGIHRGFFVKKFPQTSFRFWYFCPSLLLLYLILLTILFLSGIYSLIFFIPLFIYFIGVILDSIIISIRWKNMFIGILTTPMIFLTHLWYGVRFIQGLLIKELKS